MDEKQIMILEGAGINVKEALDRFCGNSALYLKFLLKFPQDPNFALLEKYMGEENDCEEAFKCAHTLKGVTGNLSLNEMYTRLIPLVEELRKGNLESAMENEKLLRESYDKTVNAIGKMSE